MNWLIGGVWSLFSGHVFTEEHKMAEVWGFDVNVSSVKGSAKMFMPHCCVWPQKLCLHSLLLITSHCPLILLQEPCFYHISLLPWWEENIGITLGTFSLSLKALSGTVHMKIDKKKPLRNYSEENLVLDIPIAGPKSHSTFCLSQPSFHAYFMLCILY